MKGVSVLLPVCNGERYIAEAIESVLGQTVPPVELIIVDDGSTDSTRSVLEKFSGKITLLTQPNRGQTEALLEALKIARGEYLAFQDADDIWVPQKLEWQLAALAADPALGAVFGMMRQFISPDVPVERHAAIRPAQEIAAGEVRVCMLVRRSEFERIGNFDPYYRGVSFTEWLGRAKRMGLKSRILDRIVALRRLHLHNYGRTETAERDASNMDALRSLILRRRQAT
jgi:glycosyltransferase involved in cell wall biosynthesis